MELLWKLMAVSVVTGICIAFIGLNVQYWSGKLMTKVEALVCTLVTVPIMVAVVVVTWVEILSR